jgi:fatty acid desaturase
MDDFSGNFQPLRTRLVAESGSEYLRYLGTLKPRYRRVWLEIALGYLALALVLYLAGLGTSTPARLAGALLGAVGIGYGVAFLQLFLHEASHYNIAPNRKLNDLLCDALISWQVGTSVARYRPIHFAHHRHLGTRADTENSYFRPLGPRLLLETVSGVHALRILLNRRRQVDRLQERGSGRRQSETEPLVRGVLLHALVAIAAYGLSGWPGLAAWLLGVGAVYPVFATLRQLLKHRSVDADAGADYAQVDHGALSRMFGSGPLASTFGAAGFNRHLLHHWEPQVSCTRLGDLESYLENTSAAALVTARRTSYLHAFAALWRQRGVATAA